MAVAQLCVLRTPLVATFALELVIMWINLVAQMEIGDSILKAHVTGEYR